MPLFNIKKRNVQNKLIQVLTLVIVSTALSFSYAQDVSETVVLIDMRSPDKFNAEHLDNAINIELKDIGTKIPESYPDKKTLIELYGNSGNLSGLGKNILEKQGYTNVKNLGSYAELKKKK